MANSRKPGQPTSLTERSGPRRQVRVFYSYAHQDERLRKDLDKHLAVLRRSSQIATWHDRQILPGTEFDNQIDHHLVTSDIILLLVSSDFLASDYCYRREMRLAIQRHAAGLVRVIPIILRPCDWQDSPIGGFQALPRDGKPVVTWQLRDQALLDVAKGLRKIVEELAASSKSPRVVRAAPRKA